MRVVRVAPPASAPAWRRTGFTAAAFTAVGAAALAGMLAAPREPAPVGVLAAVAALSLGVATALAWRAFSRRSPPRADDDLVRLLAPLFDDSYLLVTSPRVPGAPDLVGLLLGPPGVRALVARGWHGRYRVRGKRWEYDTRSRRGWTACRTNPTWDAEATRQSVVRWAREAGVDAGMPIEAAVIFPRRESDVVLEEPTIEVVTRENAPWWAARIGRAQRVDAGRVDRLAQLVASVSEHTPMPIRGAGERAGGG